ncbi:ZrgA family zinc uptake protein [Aliidiomarina indica]|uniref:ZrgA family zinc uptake protein n=1 Tax=Aliidiomarina indica TaxID=2749147 RepID=UPI0018907031|nr:DUF2796 domain-containing protein [Aliidiomarina indica]
MKKAVVALGVSGALVAGWYAFSHFGHFGHDHAHSHDHGHNHSHSHDHGAGGHAHGVGQMSLFVDNTDVSLFFHAPAGDVIGFEHYPRDEEERAHAGAALTFLASGEWMQFPQRAECTLQSGTADSDQLDEANEGHADVTVDLMFTCERPRHLTQATVQLFETYSALERIDAHWIRGNNTDTAELTPAITTFRIR